MGPQLKKVAAATNSTFLLRRWGSFAAIGGFWATPLSIAVSETLLAAALLARVIQIIRDGRLGLPRVCWLWLGWAVLEFVTWLCGSPARAGWGEMRHLLLIASIFVVLPVLNFPRGRLIAWRGILVTSTVGSAALLINTVLRTVQYRTEISAGGDTAFYLRNGGFLHHWMIYATVELLVFGALLEYRNLYPEDRKWTTPALCLHCLAAFFSLTRILWIGCFVLAAMHLVWRRSKWVFVLPVIALVGFLLAPGSVRSRMVESSQLDYYSNAERVQMWHVGMRMIREHPILGVGAGRVEELYPSYLKKGETLPAYHGHLHNNALQLAAQFGLPVLCAALLWLAMLLMDLYRRHQRAEGSEDQFLCRSALLGIAGFLIAGLTDYTYGHALGLILFSFVAVSPLLLKPENPGIT